MKDRGYAFEEKLNSNTKGLLNKQLKEQSNDEAQAKMPLMLFNSVITRDGRKMIISTQPVSFLMRPCYDTLRDVDVDIDGVDYQALFAKQEPAEPAHANSFAHERHFSLCVAQRMVAQHTCY